MTNLHVHIHSDLPLTDSQLNIINQDRHWGSRDYCWERRRKRKRIVE